MSPIVAPRRSRTPRAHRFLQIAPPIDGVASRAVLSQGIAVHHWYDPAPYELTWVIRHTRRNRHRRAGVSAYRRRSESRDLTLRLASVAKVRSVAKCRRCISSNLLGCHGQLLGKNAPVRVGAGRRHHRRARRSRHRVPIRQRTGN